MKKQLYILFSLMSGILVLHSCGSSADENTTNNEHLIADSSRVDDKDEISYEALCSCLNKYDPKKLSSVNDCIVKFAAVFDGMSEEQADSLFKSVFVKLSNTANQVTPEIDYKKDHDKNGNLLSSIEKPMNDIGYFHDQEEGNYYYAVHIPYLEKHFYTLVSSKMKKYLDYKLQYPDHIAHDAGISIPWMELAERLNKQEELLSMGSFIMIDDIAELYIMEFYWMAHGLDNTPVFMYETDEVDPEAKAAMVYLAEQGKPILKEAFTVYVTQLEKNGDKRGTDMYELYDQNKIRKMLKENYRINIK